MVISFFNFTFPNRKQLIFEWVYLCHKSRRITSEKLYHKGHVTKSQIYFELKKTRAKIVDVCIDEEFNLLCLSLLSGTPHVMISSLYTKVKIVKMIF